jgi:UDP-glucose 4-epimerase
MPAQSEADPAADAQLTFPPLVRVLESLSGGTSLTLISSGGTVYGEPQRLPVDEAHPTEPLSAYGVIKLAAEKLVAMYARRSGFSARILRCANVYGEGQPVDRGQGVIAVFTARALADEPAVIYGDGRTIRDYVYIGDVVDAALALIERPSRPEIVNVGSGHGYSVNEIVAAVERAAGRQLALDRRPARDFDVSEIVLDITRLRALSAFEPTSLDEGVRRTLDAQLRQTAAEPHTAAR